jgi:hypothetical protein
MRSGLLSAALILSSCLSVPQSEIGLTGIVPKTNSELLESPELIPGQCYLKIFNNYNTDLNVIIERGNLIIDKSLLGKRRYALYISRCDANITNVYAHTSDLTIEMYNQLNLTDQKMILLMLTPDTKN